MTSSACGINFFFFFKQKTAYEMRISDWSSDVCSSDLPTRVAVADDQEAASWLKDLQRAQSEARTFEHVSLARLGGGLFDSVVVFENYPFDRESRSDERRVGKEGVSTCRSRWPADN